MEAAPDTVTDGPPQSALELFHPAGNAPRVRIVGGGCPPALLHALPQSHDEAPADLVILAPAAAERRAAWLVDAARRAAAALADDGVAFLIAPVPWRFRLLAAARAAGLGLGPSVLHVPDLASSRYLVTVGRHSLRYVRDSQLRRSTWKARAASVAAPIPGGARAVGLSSAVSVVARRPAARPLFDWLAEAAGQPVPPERVVVARTWRAAGGAFAVAVVDGAAQPRVVAHVGSSPAARREELGEERALAAFAASAEAAGAAVPRVLASSSLHGAPLVIETGVPGRVAASLLAERPRETSTVLERTLAWLERWNRLTATKTLLTREYLEQEVLEPARAVTPSVLGGGAHLDLLERLCAAAVGSNATLVAAHDDLTMTNVLLQSGGGLGVVDWGTARPAALPLVDFFYAVVDTYAAAERYADRPRAFATCFAHGAQPPSVSAHQARLGKALSVEPQVLELAFHACWLHHAANELARGETEGPFLAIVHDLAAQPTRFSPLSHPRSS